MAGWDGEGGVGREVGREERETENYSFTVVLYFSPEDDHCRLREWMREDRWLSGVEKGGDYRERERKCKQRKIEEHSSARLLFFQSII